MRWLVALAVLIGAIGLIATTDPHRPSSRPTPSVDENAKLDAEIAHALKTTGVYVPKNARKAPPPSEVDRVKITDFTWGKTGFGSVMEASFTVRNSLPYAVKDIAVKCSLHGESGTEIGRAARTIYRRFPPGATRVKDFSMGFINDQARGAWCEVVGVQK